MLFPGSVPPPHFPKYIEIRQQNRFVNAFAQKRRQSHVPVAAIVTMDVAVALVVALAVAVAWPWL